MSVYEFDMDAAHMDECMRDEEYPVLKYVYVPMGALDKAKLLSGWNDPELPAHRNYDSCTMWVIVLQEGDDGVADICVWPLADDYSCPDDSPFMSAIDSDDWEPTVWGATNDCITL